LRNKLTSLNKEKVQFVTLVRYSKDMYDSSCIHRNLYRTYNVWQMQAYLCNNYRRNMSVKRGN